MNARTAQVVRPVVFITVTLASAVLLPALRGRAECTTTASPPTVVIEKRVTTRTNIAAPSIAADRCGRFLIGFEGPSPTVNYQRDVYFLRYDVDTTTMPYATETDGTVLSTQSAECPTLPETTINSIISVAIGPATQPEASPPIYATWLSVLNGQFGLLDGRGYRLRYPAAQAPGPTTWTFDQTTQPAPIEVSLCAVNGAGGFNSAGLGGADPPRRTSSWTAREKAGGSGPIGLLAEKPTFEQVRTDDRFVSKYAPCISTSDDGRSVLVWAEPQNPAAGLLSPLDIFIAQFDRDGNPVPPGTPVGVLVNSPEPPNTAISQESPAVSFVGDRIVVVFEGPDKLCPSKRRIYARRFLWGGSHVPATQPIPLDAEEFPVDNDHVANLVLGSPPHNNATVSITTSTQPADQGKFFVAWNSTPSAASGDVEVRGRYFNADGTPRGGEFKVNQTALTTQPTDGDSRKYFLANSGQHTAVYGPDRQVIVAYSAGVGQPKGVFFTYLPPGYADTLPDACIAGDVNGDGRVNGDDIQPFVTYWLDGIPSNLSDAEQARIRCAMDCDRSAAIDDCDWSVFVWLLLGLPTTGDFATDCNGNCQPDFVDAARYAFPLLDCQQVVLSCPCEGGDCCLCGLMPTSPPSGLRMQDCNGNEIDDATDIAQQTSEDCNTNGFPDECEPDCNSNGYPDDCDVAEERSPDCNGNGYPDECDFDLPFFPSFDCNTNGVPDECDMASAYSSDENANNIPDECEEGGQQMMAGGGGETDAGGTPTPPGEMFDDPAWVEFFTWHYEQQAALRAMSRPERFEATRAKLRSLGLPDAIPWAHVRTAP
jgi:hypothetical protein